MASIKDVAKHAGVAISTVSKVLNQYPGVSNETKDRVNRAISELNYVPNAVAAALSSKQSNRIALLIRLSKDTQAIDEISMRYLSGALHEALTMKMDVVTIFFSMLEGKTIEEVENYLHSQNINGLIIYGLGRTDLILNELVARQNFKVVLVDGSNVNSNTSCVWIDQCKAQYEVAEKTLETISGKAENLLYISGPEGAYVMDARLNGIRQFCKDHSLKLTIENGSFSEKTAHDITLKHGKDNDIIVCASDLMAIGAMHALKALNLKKPVCGFDGITLMAYVAEDIYTVSQNFSDISRTAIREVSNLLAGNEGREIIEEHTIGRLKYNSVIH